MKRNKLTALIVLILVSLFLFAAIADIGARKGCCSHHGGVERYQCSHGGTGYRCGDGTSLSATCDPYYAECNEYTSPQVTTNAATSVTTISAMLNGNLDSTGAPVTLEPEHSGSISCQIWFEYGKTTSYGLSTPKQSTSSAGSFSASISGLDDDTTYHFRAVASSGVGTDYGSDMTFTTEATLSQNWIKKADTPEAGGYGEAVVGTDNYIYIARCLYASSTPYFWRYDPTMDEWDSMNTSGLPTGAFRNGAALTWDNESFIYALLGGRYSDTNRRLFYRYSISNNSWEQLIDTSHAQGAGDAITWSGYDSNIYGIMGSKGHGTDFAYYNISTNSWNALPFNPNWTTTDDGASLVWTGEDYLYALRGEWQETVPCQDFARYYIPTKTWEDMEDIPESEGVGDGASLLWIDEYPDYIFALGGGSCLEDPGYNFYRYSISSDSWEQLEHIPCPIGYYVGNRLGLANGHIYYWQGAPSTWDCGGDALYMFEFPSPLLPEDTNEIPTTPLIYKISPCDAIDISFENVTVTDFLNATNMTTVQVYNFKGYKGENCWMVQWSSSNRLLNVYVNVATGNISGIEEQTYSGPSPTPLPMPTPTPTATLFEKIEGLTAIRVSSGGWDNWDADMENDGPVIYIVYLDARGDMITDDSTGKMPISADVKLYASDSVLGPCDKLVFSAHYTEDEIILGSIFPDIRIPKEEISVNPSTDYWRGAVEVTIYTPAQGSFADRGNYIRLYEE